jgi:integrase/recombinase XerD
VVGKRYERCPFSDELDDFCCWLQHVGYTRYTTGRHLRRLFQVLTQSRLSVKDEMSVELLHRAFGRRCTSARRSRPFRATEWAYSRYLGSRGRLVEHPLQDTLSGVCDVYRNYLVEVHGFSRSTVANRLVTASEFLRSALRPGESTTDLRRTHVERYLATKSAVLTRHSLRQKIGQLRGFLRFAAAKRLLVERLDVIDTPRIYREELPPRALPWNTVQKLLRSVDRTSKCGRRDYAILHLMAYYGLRASEIAGLRIDSIDWLAKTCRIEQRKNHSDLVLPLSDQTISVLRRYVLRERGSDPRPSLFLRITAPSGGMEFHTVCEVFYRWAARSDLPLSGYSSYCLRHSFAMRLLQRGVGVKAIGDLLGHKSMEATCWYLRLDTAGLRPVALPLPRARPPRC